jgi:pimeloyl-ACP methyl ester carboxylesterase
MMLRTMRSGDDFAQHQIDLGGQNILLAAEYGPRETVPTVYLHGFMGSRLEPRVALEPLGNVIAVDRPGYGGSFLDGTTASLRGFAVQLTAALDKLEVASCRLVGVSAGGPYAAAAAVELGSRVQHLSLVCSLADPSALSHGRARLIMHARRHLRLIRLIVPRVLQHARRSGFDRRMARFVMRRDLLRIGSQGQEHVLDRLLASYREGTRHGLAGMFADIAILTNRWDFDPTAITVPTLILEGGADTVVGARQGAWWRTQLPDARHIVVPDETHISLVVNHADRIASGVWD